MTLLCSAQKLPLTWCGASIDLALLCTAALRPGPVFHAFPHQEISMYANGTFKNPFTDFDFTKIAGEFKLPTVNVETVVETARKNFAVLTTANTAAVETAKTIAQRQGDMVRA